MYIQYITYSFSIAIRLPVVVHKHYQTKEFKKEFNAHLKNLLLFDMVLVFFLKKKCYYAFIVQK
jgi:hypothetical protein